MKKSIFVFAAIFSFAVLFTACKETKKEEVKEEVKMENHEGHDHDMKEVASNDVYQCPMDCEKGKTYTKEGACPKCKMDLKVLGAKHTDDCKCKEGGECKCAEGKCECLAKAECTKCEPGKCTCKKEVAKVEKECTHCEPGSCECKA